MMKFFRIAASAVVLTGGLCVATHAAGTAANKAANKQAEALMLAAFDLEDKGDLDGAIAKFREAHQLKPADKGLNQNLADALNTTGVTLYNNKDYTAATARFSEALALVPNFARAKENLGKVTAAQLNADGHTLYKAGNLDQAREKYAAAVAADPGNTSAKANLATVEADILARGTDLAAIVQKRKEALSYVPDSPTLKQRYDDAVAAEAAAEQAKKAEDEKKK